MINRLKNRSMSEPMQPFFQERQGNVLSDEHSVNGTADKYGSQYVVESDADGNVISVSEGVASAPTGYDVTHVSQGILAANPNRTGVIITNRSDTWIYLAFGTAAIVDSGIALTPRGGTYNAYKGSALFSTDRIEAIHDGTIAKRITIQEFE